MDGPPPQTPTFAASGKRFRKTHGAACHPSYKIVAYRTFFFLSCESPRLLLVSALNGVTDCNKTNSFQKDDELHPVNSIFRYPKRFTEP